MIEKVMVDGHERMKKDGKFIPSLSRIFKELGISPSFEFVSELDLEWARQNGTIVHDALEEFAKTNNFPKVEDEQAGYLQSFKLWYEKNLPVFMTTEESIAGETALGNLFMGRVDAVIELGGKKIAIDYKTSKTISKLHKIQTAGYKVLFDTDEAGVLQLFEDGKEAKLIIISKKYYDKLENIVNTYYDDSEEREANAKMYLDETTDIDMSIARAIAKAKAELDASKKRYQYIEKQLKEQVGNAEKAVYKDGKIKVSYSHSDDSIVRKTNIDAVISELFEMRGKKVDVDEVLNIIRKNDTVTVKNGVQRITIKMEK